MSPRSAGVAAVCPSRSIEAVSLPVDRSTKCSLLSHPEANVRPPATGGVANTGPPGTLNCQRFLPAESRQYKLSSPQPNRIRSSVLASSPTALEIAAKLAPEVTSFSVVNFQTSFPAVLRQ